MRKPKSVGAAAAAPTMDSDPIISTRYNYESIQRPAVAFIVDPADPNYNPLSVSVTNQSDKDSSDINIIMARYEKTGLITVNGVSRQPTYADFTVVGDYLSQQNTIAKVTQAFAVLPADTRSRFGNDPAKLVEFLADPTNDPEAVKLGLKTQDQADLDAQAAQAAAAASAAAAGAANGTANGTGSPPVGSPASPAGAGS